MILRGMKSEKQRTGLTVETVKPVFGCCGKKTNI